ncbi:cell division control protein 6 homolog B-like [Rosa rugosa]|uniref:cell division control protein 6 homolog B-like n=1 Tax=Rosa rugosa TaxID=74645 RepID=UPI002B406009|nr:cell division control protein 6 homolog B-like [Rosa rugosa]
MPSIADRSVELESNAVGSAGVSTPPKRRLRSNSSPMKLSPMKCKRVGISSVVKLRSVKVESERSVEEVVGSGSDLTPQKRKLRSDSSSPMKPRPVSSPMKCKSARRNLNACTSTPANGIEKYFSQKKPQAFCKPPVVAKPNWNPRGKPCLNKLGLNFGTKCVCFVSKLANCVELVDKEQMRIVKEALHLSTVPSTVACRDVEQKRVLEFCKSCIEQEKPGSLYVCGCPGTGKSLSMEKVKQLLVNWAGEGRFQEPDVLELNCTSLTKTSDIFAKILGKYQPQKKANGTTSLQLLQKLYSQKPQSDGTKMMLIIADELDYLITKDRAVLHDLFMLTTYPFSRCILLGVANAIDLADRFVPKLQSLNCKPMVITFRAYSKDQILKILQERLMALPCTVFQPHALELCARKVAAASGDMRKALCISRSAIEMLEAELRESTDKLNSSTAENPFSEQQTAPALALVKKQEIDIVRIDHMAIALSKTFKSPVVDTIQCLPQHQQIIMCSAAKHFRGVKKDTTIGELNKSYVDICKATLIPPVGSFEFSSMCKVLNDQGLLKLSGQSRDIKSKRVTLNVDEGDITFALQGIRFFRTCLE